MADSEMIDVVVTAEHTVRYCQYRRIPKSLFEKYESLCAENAHDDEFLRAFEHLIDYADVYDSDELEDLTIEVEQKNTEAADGSLSV